MVLAAPEFVIAEPVEVLDEIEIAAELQQRMLADRMVRGEKGAELQTRHKGLPRTRGERLVDALDDPQVAVGPLAEGLERFLVPGAVMGGRGLLDAVELDDNG